jgi:hypothetical protein
METFNLTEQHIALLKRAYVDWQDMETGAPAIDPKRPYGNSDVVGDVATILSLPEPEGGDYEKLLALHRETQTALQVILQFQSFEPATFVRKERWLRWERAPQGASTSPSTTSS